MGYLVEIDEKKKLGKSALSMLRNIAAKGNGIRIRRTSSFDISEDARMVKKMLIAKKMGFVNTGKFLEKLKSQL